MTRPQERWLPEPIVAPTPRGECRRDEEIDTGSSPEMSRIRGVEGIAEHAHPRATAGRPLALSSRGHPTLCDHTPTAPDAIPTTGSADDVEQHGVHLAPCCPDSGPVIVDGSNESVRLRSQHVSAEVGGVTAGCEVGWGTRRLAVPAGGRSW